MSEKSRSEELSEAVTDFLHTLSGLNHELNDDVPSENINISDASIPSSVAYSVAEVARMLRTSRETEREAWAVDTAWLAVLAGDIDDVHEHVRGEEAAL
jgi:hypothetical protein